MHSLADPKVALHQAALRDLYFLVILFIAAFMVASSYELGDWYIVAVTAHPDWELDEVAIAAMLSMVAFCWFAYRQWRRRNGLRCRSIATALRETQRGDGQHPHAGLKQLGDDRSAEESVRARDQDRQRLCRRGHER